MSAHNENLVIVIPARKNSKRLQSKNLKHFYGFPLFEWSLAAGLFLKQKLSNLRKISVVCTSDDDEVLNLVKKKYSSSVQAVRRKPELSDDNSVLSDVIIDCIYRLASENVIRLDDYLHGRYILLQPTSPVRLKYDLICFSKQIKNFDKSSAIVSVNKRNKETKDVYELIYHGEIKPDYSMGLIGRQLLASQEIQNNSNTAFVDGSLYLGSTYNLREMGFMPEGKTLAFPLSIDYSIDIDTEEEFEKALVLIKKLESLGIDYVKPSL